MRLLNDGVFKGLKAFAVLVLLCGCLGEASQAQQAGPRASRYRLVDSLGEASSVQASDGTEVKSRRGFDDDMPKSDFVTAADQTASARGSSQSKVETAAVSGGNKARIVAAGYLASAPKKAANKPRARQTRNWGHVGDHGSAPGYPIAAPAEFPFVDQYRAFPARNGLGKFYGKNRGSSWTGQRNSESLFGVDQRHCCDEWDGFCPCVAADCDCGGLKTNPGHGLFKRLSSGEPCGTGCQSGGCSDCGFNQNAGCASGCGSAEGRAYNTATQRRCPLLSSWVDKYGVKDQRPLDNVGPLNQSCGRNECQSGYTD